MQKKLKILTIWALVLLLMSFTTTFALQANVNVVANGNNYLVLDLQKQMMKIDPAKNSCFSPNSIYTALAPMPSTLKAVGPSLLTLH